MNSRSPPLRHPRLTERIDDAPTRGARTPLASLDGISVAKLDLAHHRVAVADRSVTPAVELERSADRNALPKGSVSLNLCHMANRDVGKTMSRAAENRAARVAFDPSRHTRPALAGFFRIMEAWGADKGQARAILGQPSERTFYRWKTGRAAALPTDVIRRIGYVSGIWKALQIVYSNPQHADEWVRKPNRSFGGQTPLERMSAGDVTDLAAVRQYVDAARAPWS